MCAGVSGQVTAWNGSMLAVFGGPYVSGATWLQVDSTGGGCCWSLVGSTAFVDGNDEQVIASKSYPGI